MASLQGPAATGGDVLGVDALLTSSARDPIAPEVTMGTFNVDGTGRPGILHLKLVGRMSPDEMRAFVDAHNAAIDAFEGGDYRVFCDVSDMAPLSPDCAALFEEAKAYSSAHDNFQGSAVLVKSSLVALQHERTSVAGGVMSTELISTDEDALWEHLAAVSRRAG